MMAIIRIIQGVLMAVPLVLFGWLFNQWFVLDQIFEVEYEMGETSAFIDALKPETRVSALEENPQGEMFQSILEDPVFFFVHPHRDFFGRVALEIWFQNTFPIVELGALADVDPETYTLYPLHNRLIDDSNWDRLEQDGHVLLQREKRFDSIEAFLEDPPSREKVAVYRTSLHVPYRMEDYQPMNVVQTIDVSLRGHHEFKTYIKEETLSFFFRYMDMNRDDGEDVVRAIVFNDTNQPVAEARAPDDGNASDDGIVDQGLKRLDLAVSGLPEGVYKVVLDTTRDVFFRNIETTQQKLIFLDSLFIGDEVGYRDPAKGATFYTQAKQLRMQTRHAQGVQTVQVGESTLDLEQPYEWVAVNIQNPGLEEVTLPQGDAEIVAQGVFAFSDSQYFNPDPVSLDASTSLEQLGVDYVLAQYTSPRREGDWLVATALFDTGELYSQEQTWKFSFSAPLIQKSLDRLWIHRINAIFYRD